MIIKKIFQPYFGFLVQAPQGVAVKKLQKKRRRKKEPIMMIRPNDVSFPGVRQEQPSTQPIRANLWGLGQE